MAESPKKSTTVRRRRVVEGTEEARLAADTPLDVPIPQPSTRQRQAAPQTEADSSASGAKPDTDAAQRTAATAPNVLFFVYASLAGLFGALSSVVGKVAVAADAVPQLVGFVTDRTGLAPPSPESPLFTLLPLALRVLFFAANAVFTGQMWRYYIKSLSLGPTPVCQIINTGTNFAVSAFCGVLFFGEVVNTTWAIGAFLVVIGLGLVVTDPTAVSS